jgi:hypothetical protein
MIKPRLVSLVLVLVSSAILACGPSGLRRQSSTFGGADLGVSEPDAAAAAPPLTPMDAAPATGNADLAPTLPAGLVLYWKLDEEAGLFAEDASGKGLRGTFVFAPASSADVPPVMFAFANPRSRAFVRGSRQAIVLSGMPPAIKPPATVTVAAWYRSTSLDVGGGANTPASDVVSAGDVYLLRLRPNEVEVSKRIGGPTTSAGWARCRGPAPNPVDGRWHHLAAVIDVDAMHLYFDGAAVCRLANAQPMVYDRGEDLWVGRHGDRQTTYEFDGNVDEVRVYDRALAAPEVAALANGAL